MGGVLRRQRKDARRGDPLRSWRALICDCSLAGGDYFAIDGHGSHEKVHLADGIVDGYIIECPKHFGTFDYRTGEARALPACIDLHSYEVKVEGDTIFIKI